MVCLSRVEGSNLLLAFVGVQVGENITRSILKTNIKGKLAAMKIYQGLWLNPET